MKIQQKLDRALESFVRINMTSWRWDAPEAERAKINAQVRSLISKIRDGMETDYGDVVAVNDRARAPADEMREKAEAAMEALAKELPVYSFVESVRGAGALGLATIIAEAGHLYGYRNVAKLWKRLGYAPYDGLAGSTWKRESWRPRALTAQEWMENPFKGERYALMAQIATWLVNAQTKSKTKTESGETEGTGTYGEIYVRRRAACMIAHPEWSDGHRRNDALRITMKEFTKDLFLRWHGIEPYDAALDTSPAESETAANTPVKPSKTVRPSSPASRQLKPNEKVPGSPTQTAAKSGPAKPPVKPRKGQPGSLSA